MVSKEEFEKRKYRSYGRPAQEDKSKLREKKVMLSFTQEEYDELKRMQELLNKSTLTSTINFFIARGREALAEEFMRQK